MHWPEVPRPDHYINGPVYTVFLDRDRETVDVQANSRAVGEFSRYCGVEFANRQVRIPRTLAE